MKLRIAGIEEESIVDGPGWRYVIFTQGCPHQCKGCHNPKTHDVRGGLEIDTDDILKHIGENPLVTGITFSGGEPMLQAKALLEIAIQAKEKGLNIWCYTGYTLEELLEKNDPDQMNLLWAIDVLVDGPYVSELRSMDLLYRGSSNQNIIYMNEERKANG